MIRRLFLNIVHYLLRITIIVACSVFIGFIISKVMNQPLNHVLEFIGILMLAVGGLSMAGDVNTQTNVNVNLGKLTSGGSKFIGLDRELTAGSNVFAILTGSSGMLILVTTLLIYYF